MLEGVDQVDIIAAAGKFGNIEVAYLQLQFGIAPLNGMAGRREQERCKHQRQGATG